MNAICRLLFLLTLLTGIPLAAADPPSKEPVIADFRDWLDLPKSINPTMPQIAASVNGNIPLAYGRVYRAKAKEPFRVECVPDDSTITIEYKKGPLVYNALWVGGTEDYEEVTLEEPFLAIIKAKKGQKGTPTLLFIPEKVDRVRFIPRCTLEVNGGAVTPAPAPKPVDPVVPVEPEETDVDVRSLKPILQVAYNAEAKTETDKAASVKKLAQLYRAMAQDLGNPATWEKLAISMRDARSRVIQTKIPKVRDAVATFLDSKWAVEPNSPMTDADKKAAATFFNQAAKALEGIR